MKITGEEVRRHKTWNVLLIHNQERIFLLGCLPEQPSVIRRVPGTEVGGFQRKRVLMRNNPYET